MSRSSSRHYRSRSALRLRRVCQLLASGRPKGSRSSGSRSVRLPDVLRVSRCEASLALLELRAAHQRGAGARTWHPASWPRTRSARASSARVSRALLPGSLVRGSGTCGFLRQRTDAAEHDQHQHVEREYLQQEIATLDKDRHDRVKWLCGHNREQNSGRTGKLLCPSHEHEGGTDGNRAYCGQR